MVGELGEQLGRLGGRAGARPCRPRCCGTCRMRVGDAAEVARLLGHLGDALVLRPSVGQLARPRPGPGRAPGPPAAARASARDDGRVGRGGAPRRARRAPASRSSGLKPSALTFSRSASSASGGAGHAARARSRARARAIGSCARAGPRGGGTPRPPGAGGRPRPPDLRASPSTGGGSSCASASAARRLGCRPAGRAASPTPPAPLGGLQLGRRPAARRLLGRRRPPRPTPTRSDCSARDRASASATSAGPVRLHLLEGVAQRLAAQGAVGRRPTASSDRSTASAPRLARPAAARQLDRRRRRARRAPPRRPRRGPRRAPPRRAERRLVDVGERGQPALRPAATRLDAGAGAPRPRARPSASGSSSTSSSAPASSAASSASSVGRPARAARSCSARTRLALGGDVLVLAAHAFELVERAARAASRRRRGGRRARARAADRRLRPCAACCSASAAAASQRRRGRAADRGCASNCSWVRRASLRARSRAASSGRDAEQLEHELAALAGRLQSLKAASCFCSANTDARNAASSMPRTECT